MGKKVKYIIITLFILGISLRVVRYKYESTFSTKRWIKYEEKRDLMVEDMLEKYDLVGKSKEQIIELLGEETGHPFLNEQNNLVYILGNNSRWGIDEYWLIITFENEVVSNVEIVEG